MTKNEALRMGMDALVSVLANHKGAPVVPWNDALDGMKAALEAKDEPVAWRYKSEPSFDGNKWHDTYELTASKQVALWKDKDAKPLYTTPPQRTWVGLTDEDRLEFAKAQHGWEDLLIAAEAKLKEKNT
jgi:hypothetical protein